MIYDKQKNEDVKSLKRFRKLKDQTQYMGFKKALILKYNVTGRTIEMWLAQRTPGARKVRTDSGKIRNKITAKEKKVAAELLESGTKIKDVKKVAGVSKRKLDRIREQVESTFPRGSVGTSDDGESATADAKNAESNFGDEAKEMFRKLFQLDLVAPDRGIGVPVRGKKFIIPKEDCEDICLILANAHNRTGHTKFKVDRNELLKMRIFHLIEAQARLASVERVDSKTIESITRQYDRMQVLVKMDADFKCVERICKDLKPDISFTEIVSLVKKHSASDES